MAPKSALLTAGTDDLQKRTGPPANIPWTTREKLADIEAKKSRPPIKQSLPPPGEMTEEANLSKKKKWSKPKPRTTREKIKDAEAKRRATEGGQAKSKSKDSKNDAKAQKYSVYKAIQSQHIASTHQDKSKVRKQSVRPNVLVRPTERAKRSRLENKKVYEARKPNNLRAGVSLPIGNQQGTTYPTCTSSDPILEKRMVENPGASDAKRQRTDELEVATQHQGNDKTSSSGSSESSEIILDWTCFRIMDLPEVVRKRIWEFCVVYPNCFVWPEEKIDHEQPDLAMVDRRIRSEVLPIYYSKNRFAVALIPPTRPKSDSKNELNIRGLFAIEKWSAIIEQAGWFRFIEKWAFDYAPSISTSSLRPEEDDSLVVSVTSERKNGLQANAPEIHRDARCLLPGNSEYQKCQTANSPRWLNRLVIDVVDDDEMVSRKVVTGKTILKLAKGIKEKAEDLVRARCEDTSKIRRADSAVGGI